MRTAALLAGLRHPDGIAAIVADELFIFLIFAAVQVMRERNRAVRAGDDAAAVLTGQERIVAAAVYEQDGLLAVFGIGGKLGGQPLAD